MAETLNLDAMQFEEKGLVDESDLEFFQKCIREISLSFPETGKDKEGVSPDEAAANSTLQACHTILNFKKNPSLVLGPTTITVITCVYR